MFQCENRVRELLDLTSRGSTAVFLAFIPLDRLDSHDIERV
jgi:hypothetical protein